MVPRHLVHEELVSGKLVAIAYEQMLGAVRLPFYCIKNKGRMLGPVATSLWHQLQKMSEQNVLNQRSDALMMEKPLP